MKVFVTGATGFVGRVVAEHLQQAGHEARFLVRNTRSAEANTLFERPNTEVCEGDILDTDTLKRGLKGCDAIIHLVGIISEVGEATFENIHTRGTESVVAAAKLVGVRRFVHMSALGTRPEAVSRYHQTKWKAEESVRKSGLAATVFRPSLIYGPRDHFVNLFATWVRFSPVVPVMGRRDALMQPVHVENVAKAFVGALAEPMSIDNAFDLCGDERLTLRQIIETIEKVLNKRRWNLQIPSPFARVQALLLEKCYPTLLKKAPPFNRDQLIMLQEDNVGEPNPANHTFKLGSRSFIDGIAAYLMTKERR
jgi:uncharacterized protein YbjT (DUF2867 family)